MKGKRIFVLILAVLLIFSLGFCDSGSGKKDPGKDSAGSTEDSGKESDSKSNSNAEDNGEEGDSTADTNADDNGEEGDSTADTNADDIWITDYYRDQFEEPTEDWYVTNRDWFIGKFSNSASVNSELAVDMVADCQGKIGFLLWRYADVDSILKNISVSFADEFNIIMRDQDGVDYNLTGTMYPNTATLFIDDEYASIVFTAMLADGEISFYIERAGRSLEHYLFTIQVSNFMEEYMKMAG